VLPMLGMEALGRPITDETAHRPELVARLLGLASGLALTVTDLAMLLLDPRGGRKGAPATAAFWPVVYGVTPPTEGAAIEIARLLNADPGVRGVLIQRKGTADVQVVRHDP
jgi:probable selenium-dependent hydroxylase accessory protein YqeC